MHRNTTAFVGWTLLAVGAGILGIVGIISAFTYGSEAQISNLSSVGSQLFTSNTLNVTGTGNVVISGTGDLYIGGKSIQQIIKTLAPVPLIYSARSASNLTADGAISGLVNSSVVSPNITNNGTTILLPANYKTSYVISYTAMIVSPGAPASAALISAQYKSSNVSGDSWANVTSSRVYSQSAGAEAWKPTSHTFLFNGATALPYNELRFYFTPITGTPRLDPTYGYSFNVVIQEATAGAHLP